MADQLTGVASVCTEPRLAPALAGADSDGARGRRLLPEGVVVVFCLSPPFQPPGETLDPSSPDQTMLASHRHFPHEGIILGDGTGWRDQ